MSHTARDSMAAVRNLFPNHVISRYGDITWPARSPNLSASDFFLWGYLKSQVFKAPSPHTVQELKHQIQQEVKRIPVEMLQRVMGDICKRLTMCLVWTGGHLNDVLFEKKDFCFPCVKLLNVINWNWKNLNSFIYILCSYVLKLNKWKHVLFMTFLKSPDSLTHPVRTKHSYCVSQMICNTTH